MTRRILAACLSITLALGACSQQTTPDATATKRAKSTTPTAAPAEPLKAPVPEPPKPPERPIFSGDFDFKGVKLGASEQEVRKRFAGLYAYDFRHKTSNAFKIIGCETKYEGAHGECKTTLANRKVKDMSIVFHNNALARIRIEFNEDDFEEVLHGLREKFGEPLIINETDLRRSLTGVGSKYYEIAWTNQKGDVLSLDSHERDGSSYRPKGIMDLSTKGHHEALDVDQKRHGKKSAREDL